MSPPNLYGIGEGKFTQSCINSMYILTLSLIFGKLMVVMVSWRELILNKLDFLYLVTIYYLNL